MRWCKDCLAEGVTTKRPLARYKNGSGYVPGPRCATHNRARRAKTRDVSFDRYLRATYNITSEEYWRIYEAQGGVCYICRRAKGTGRKRLSVDHCHTTGMVRGLLCSPCNRDVVGHLRDDPQAALRFLIYLLAPPAADVIGIRITPDVLAPAA